MQKIILIIILLTACSFSEAINPVDDIHSYMIRFTRIAPGIMPDSITTMEFTDTVHVVINWYQPSRLVKYDDQETPKLYSRDFLDEVYIEVINDSSMYVNDSTVTNVAVTTNLSPGWWQIQVASSRMTEVGTLVWSKYSDAVGLHLWKPVTPFDRPVQVLLRIVKK